MPLAVNGTGTMFLGEGQRDRDGSFVTTKWVTLAFLPLVPLGSYRVQRDPSTDTNVLVYRSEGYRVLAPRPLAWGQIFGVYLFAILSLAWWTALLVALPRRLDLDEASGWLSLIVALMVLAPLPFLILWALRRHAGGRYVASAR